MPIEQFVCQILICKIQNDLSFMCSYICPRLFLKYKPHVFFLELSFCLYSSLSPSYMYYSLEFSFFQSLGNSFWLPGCY